jgi:hypothetical protein
MPKPIRLYGRVLWDVRKLDVAIDALWDTLDTADAPEEDYLGATQ